MIWYKDNPPKTGEEFLAKINSNDEIFFYFLRYDCRRLFGDIFIESRGERYLSFYDKQIISWTTIDELNKDTAFV